MSKRVLHALSEVIPMRISWVIISGFCYVIGNLTWEAAGEEKLYFVPLAVFIMTLIMYVKKEYRGKNKYVVCLLEYFMLLSIGSVIKEMFYSYTIKQINDYYWGGFVTVFYFTTYGRPTHNNVPTGNDSGHW